MKRWVRILVGAGLMAVVGTIIYSLPLAACVLALLEWVRSLGTLGALIYGLAYVVGTVLLAPVTFLTASSGFLYGPLLGTLIVSPASVLGATISFLLARSFARERVAKYIGQHPRFVAIDHAVESNGFKVVFLLRLTPIFFPFSVLNYALGLTRVRVRDYVLASWLGMLPATMRNVYLGSLVRDLAQLLHGDLPSMGNWQWLMFWGGLAATVVLAVVLSRIAQQALRKTLDQDIAARRAGEEVV